MRRPVGPSMRQPRPDVQELIRSARRIRELIWQDPHRPRYHLTPPEGFFNDPNGALFWNGRYHLFYLAREPIPHPRRPGEEFWVAVWDHVSSRDLVHWIQHPPAVRPKPDGSTPSGHLQRRGDQERASPDPDLSRTRAGNLHRGGRGRRPDQVAGAGAEPRSSRCTGRTTSTSCSTPPAGTRTAPTTR